jgi:hypothetical protein
MLLPILLAMLAPPASGPRLAVRPGPPDFDPAEIICKLEREPSSRLARRKVCQTAAQWEELRRIERGNLVRHQFHGGQ